MFWTFASCRTHGHFEVGHLPAMIAQLKELEYVCLVRCGALRWWLFCLGRSSISGRDFNLRLDKQLRYIGVHTPFGEIVCNWHWRHISCPASGKWLKINCHARSSQGCLLCLHDALVNVTGHTKLSAQTLNECCDPARFKWVWYVKYSHAYENSGLCVANAQVP